MKADIFIRISHKKTEVKEKPSKLKVLTFDFQQNLSIPMFLVKLSFIKVSCELTIYKLAQEEQV